MESKLLLDLQKTAADKGFVICDSLASANCMFYTLSEQLQRVKGINISHKEIRKELVQSLKNFPNLVRSLLRRSSVLNLLKSQNDLKLLANLGKKLMKIFWNDYNAHGLL